jgi:hypothetical protein
MNSLTTKNELEVIIEDKVIELLDNEGSTMIQMNIIQGKITFQFVSDQLKLKACRTISKTETNLFTI